MKRRTFLTSTAAASGLLTSTAGCLSSADGGSSNLMLGSLADRPAVDSEFFERRSSVQRVFLETETGVKYGITDDTSDWVRLPVGGAVEAPSASELADGELAIAYDNGFELRARKTDGTTVSESIATTSSTASVAGNDGDVQVNNGGEFGTATNGFSVTEASNDGTNLNFGAAQIRSFQPSYAPNGSLRFFPTGPNGPVFAVQKESITSGFAKDLLFQLEDDEYVKLEAFSSKGLILGSASGGNKIRFDIDRVNRCLLNSDSFQFRDVYADFQQFTQLKPTSEPSTPSTDDVRVWNDGSALKVKFDDGSTQTLASK
jgi:hypothetical protein